MEGKDKGEVTKRRPQMVGKKSAGDVRTPPPLFYGQAQFVGPYQISDWILYATGIDFLKKLSKRNQERNQASSWEQKRTRGEGGLFI